MKVSSKDWVGYAFALSFLGAVGYGIESARQSAVAPAFVILVLITALLLVALGRWDAAHGVRSLSD